ncbi:798_t:CDS:2, partial [Scutellospora calospora]
FAHSFHLLLKSTSETSSNGSSYNDIDGVEENERFVNADNNIFSMFGTAILAVYIMLTGDSASLSPWVLRDNFALIILMV